MSAIPWTTVRDAIQAWIVAGSGLAGDHVVWRGQRDAGGNPMPRPTGQYIELKLMVLKWNGLIDWAVYSYDQPSNTLTQFVRGPRTALLTVTCFQGLPSGGSGAPATSSCMAVVHDAMTASGLDTVADALVAAGVGVGDFDAVQVDGGIVNDVRFEERAVVTAKLHLASEVSQVFPAGQGWIDIVNGSGQGDLAAMPGFTVTGP